MTQKEYDEKVNELRISLVEAEMQIQDIRKELDELDKVEIEPESRRWKPKEGDVYYYSSPSGVVWADKWTDHQVDLCRYTLGNVFKTEEEAEFEVERLKVIAELKAFAELDADDRWDRRNSHFYILWNHDSDSVAVTCAVDIQSAQIYFESRKMAEEAIKAVGEDRIKKYYLRIKE